MGLLQNPGSFTNFMEGPTPGGMEQQEGNGEDGDGGGAGAVPGMDAFSLQLMMNQAAMMAQVGVCVCVFVCRCEYFRKHPEAQDDGS